MRLCPPSVATHVLLPGAFALCALFSHAQGVFFSATFDDGQWPPAFDPGPDVERIGPDGEGTGEFVPAWRIGTATEANAGGFFPVPDIPVDGRFAMVNDDAPPCDCDLRDARLTFNAPSFVGRKNVALECRVFHEKVLGGGDAMVEVSAGNGPWVPIATVPVLIGEWLPLVVNLSAFDGLDDIRIRFRWSDNGNWSGGFAVDDITLRERHGTDLSVERVFAHDPLADLFRPGDQTLGHTMLPLEQAGPLTVAAELMNRGTTLLDGITLSVSVSLDGDEQVVRDTLLTGTLSPGQRTTVVLPTYWSPSSTGSLTVTFSVDVAAHDEDPSNNTGETSMHITGPGWDDGHGAMARDLGHVQGSIGGDRAYIAANRMEFIAPGSVVRGISAHITSNSAPGEEVRAILMDANLAFVDTSVRHTLTQEDLDRAWNGESLYLPMTGIPVLPAGDYFAGIQRLEGGSGSVFVGLSGNSPIGAALLMRGVNFDVEYLHGTPMVRLYLDELPVSIHDVPGTNGSQGLAVHPNPLEGSGTLSFTLERPSRTTWRLMDATGRVAQQGDFGGLPAGRHRITWDTGRLPAGTYLMEVHGDGHRRCTRVIVIH